MTKNALWIVLGLVAWSAALAATLSIAQSPGDWGHAICGPWGCGPPLQALASCHLSWLVILAPPAAVLVRSARVSTHNLRHIGILLCVATLVFVVAVVIYQRVVWWPLANEWQRGFFWQRCGFVVATTVDLPMAQLLLLDIYLANYGRSRM